MLGLTVLTMTLILYAIVALMQRLADYRQSILLVALIPTGALFFTMTQLLNYFIFMTHSFAKKQEYAALTKIAYVDNLTGLPNRVSCEEKLHELNNSQDDFCILSLDLNGLKEVNDNSGHPAGDRLLKSFSDALRSVFESVGSCHRTGGDEFMVLIKNIESSTLDEMLKALDEKLAELDKEDIEINHSVSYGYAYRHETEEKDTHTVFMLADQRMYNYKREHYAHMMGR
jgi:diguanylate cyclase (GGDEF)-like protein